MCHEKRDLVLLGTMYVGTSLAIADQSLRVQTSDKDLIATERQILQMLFVLDSVKCDLVKKLGSL